MDQRLAVALPVLPALAHAAVLRWEADHLVEHSGAGWADVIDMLRSLSVVVVLFAVALAVLAVTGRATVATWVLFLSLVPQFGYVAVLGVLRFSDATDASSRGEPSLAIAVASLATALLALAGSIVAVMSLSGSALQSRSA
jgi:hypothetical protein